ncbi:MAG TPA: phosphoglycerate mutase family protein [Candidatus Dormibacteraeota bacterium]
MGTFYVVRHAKAGSRGDWTGDDRQRPLSKKGHKQAQDLVSVLAPFPVSAVISSPFLRCLQTVEPLARAHEVEVETAESLAEGHGLAGAMRYMGDPKLDHAVLSTHGDIVWELVEELVKRHVIKPGEGGFEKGSTWVVVLENGAPVRARFIAAP